MIVSWDLEFFQNFCVYSHGCSFNCQYCEKFSWSVGLDKMLVDDIGVSICLHVMFVTLRIKIHKSHFVNSVCQGAGIGRYIEGECIITGLG